MLSLMSLKFMFLDSLAKTFRKCSLVAELSYVMWPKTQASHWTKAEKKAIISMILNTLEYTLLTCVCY